MPFLRASNMHWCVTFLKKIFCGSHARQGLIARGSLHRCGHGSRRTRMNGTITFQRVLWVTNPSQLFYWIFGEPWRFQPNHCGKRSGRARSLGSLSSLRSSFMTWPSVCTPFFPDLAHLSDKAAKRRGDVLKLDKSPPRITAAPRYSEHNDVHVAAVARQLPRLREEAIIV